MKREVRRALVSVSDKSGLAEFASRLAAAGIEIVSSGGTAQVLEDAGVPVTRVSEVTGAPEMLGGRVKTLHPRIHAGILADLDEEDHAADLDAQGIAAFELVVVNLYPFEATVAREDVTAEEAIENIDIGGPTLIRAAAKNHKWVGVVTSPDQYSMVADAVESGGLTGPERADLARAAFFATGAYDAAITEWLHRDQAMPDRAVNAFEKMDELRYGENPGQAAGVYRQTGTVGGWFSEANQLQGKPMSFNNYVDADAAWRLVSDLGYVGAAVIKHTNAAGAAVRPELADAFAAAWHGDPVAAFGGVVAANVEIDAPTAEAIVDNFVEIVIAPAISDDAAAIFGAKANLRVLAAPRPTRDDLDWRFLERGALVQRREPIPLGLGSRWDDEWVIVSARKPTNEERVDLAFAWVVAAHTKSNAVVLAADVAAVGVGAGDQSRVGAANRAIAKAGDRSQGAVAASDAFFPFRDGIDALAASGVTAIIEPGGSIRDEEVIAAADEHDIALVFTNRRYFKH